MMLESEYGIVAAFVAVVGGAWLLIAGCLLGRRYPLFLFAVHVSGRAVLDSVPEISHQSFAGVSVMQVYSITFIAAFVFVLMTSPGVRYKATIPLGLIVASLLLSSLLALQLRDFAMLSLKWVYLWVVLVYTDYMLLRHSPRRIFAVAWVAMLYPMANQLYAVAIGKMKCIPGGGCSYIGTYAHEHQLASLLVIGVFSSAALMLTSNRVSSRALFGAALALGHICLYLNGYRTALVGIAFAWGVIGTLYLIRSGVGARAAIVGGAAVLVATVTFLVGPELYERMSDIGRFVAAPMDYLGPAQDGGGERVLPLFSGRIYLINVYSYWFLEAPLENQLIGLGPRAGQETFGSYAHNELVSALFETGYVGLIVLVASLSALGVVAGRSAATLTPLGILSGGAFGGVMVWALATMPFQDMRTMLFLGMVLGTAYWTLRADESTATAPAPSAAPRSPSPSWPQSVPGR